MKYPKIHSAIEFLQTDSEGGVTDMLDIGAMTLKNALKCEEEAHKRNADTKGDLMGDSSPLLKLAYKAEYGGKRDAATACITLAKLYLGIENHKDMHVPHSDEIAVGFLARARALMDEKAFGSTLDGIMKKLSTEDQERISNALASDDRKENSNKKITDLLELIRSHVESNRSNEALIKQQLARVESCISDKVYRLREQLDLPGDKTAHKRRRSRWIRRIIVVLILILLLPGCLNGPGEGVQGFFHFLFLIPNTLHVFDAYEINSFADYISAMPDDDERVQMYGMLLMIIPILNLVLSVILYFISNFRMEYLFARQKQALCEEYGISNAVAEAGKIYDASTKENKRSERQRIVALGVYNAYYIWDELVVFYHIRLFCKDPDSTYAVWKVQYESFYEHEPSSSGGPSLYDRYNRSQSSSESSGWGWKDEVKITDNWGVSRTTDADMAHSLGYIDHDDYMKILAAKDEAEFERRNKN